MDDDRLHRHDLTDAEWAAGAAAAGPVRGGGRWADHRMVINGMFWRTRAGCPWRDLPARFGNWKTVYNRHRRWSGDGTWVGSWTRCGAGATMSEGPEWTIGVDARWSGPISTPPVPATPRPPTSRAVAVAS